MKNNIEQRAWQLEFIPTDPFQETYHSSVCYANRADAVAEATRVNKRVLLYQTGHQNGVPPDGFRDVEGLEEVLVREIKII
jgi:hypothetical protein